MLLGDLAATTIIVILIQHVNVVCGKNNKCIISVILLRQYNLTDSQQYMQKSNVVICIAYD